MYQCKKALRRNMAVKYSATLHRHSERGSLDLLEDLTTELLDPSRLLTARPGSVCGVHGISLGCRHL